MQESFLSLLTDYLSDLHISSTVAGLEDHLTLSRLDHGLRDHVLKMQPPVSPRIITKLEPGTVYHIRDYFHCRYSFFSLSEDHSRLFFIGPYTLYVYDDAEIRLLMEQLQIPEELYQPLCDYYHSIPYINEREHFNRLLLRFYSRICSVENPDSIYIDLMTLEPEEDFIRQHTYKTADDNTLSIQLLAQRYHAEDELLTAVSQGNTQKALSCMGISDSISIAPRSADSLVHAKSLAITFNTLLRLTVYHSGVHPFYVNSVSENFAKMILAARNHEEVHMFYSYMIESYCRLVQKNNMVSYSEPVKYILVSIDAALDSDLSLKRFAGELFLSTSYLSTLFKKEVGQTLTDYVNKSRISAAQKLLRSTTRPIQDIAVQCGIPDIHYFTRLFRRETGMTPKEYRSRFLR